jgi:hypothetical protein
MWLGVSDAEPDGSGRVFLHFAFFFLGFGVFAGTP